MGGINGESVDNNNSQPTLQGNGWSHPPHWSSMNWAVMVMVVGYDGEAMNVL